MSEIAAAKEEVLGVVALLSERIATTNVILDDVLARFTALEARIAEIDAEAAAEIRSLMAPLQTAYDEASAVVAEAQSLASGETPTSEEPPVE